jgi:hypothetical protein
MVAKKIELSNNNLNSVVKKRGRKSKKEIESLQSQDNINVIIEETSNANKELDENNIIEALNSEVHVEIEDNQDNQDNENISFLPEDSLQNEETKPIAKKRGRKPKGGKIIQQIVPLNNNKETKPNIILHLKCSLKDLQTNISNNSDISGFDFKNSTQLSYDNVSTDSNIFYQKYNTNDNVSVTQTKTVEDDTDYEDDNKSVKENDIRDVWKKLKVLEHNLHINNICDKKSACFWCTYEFDNPPVYIPKHYIKGSYQVYGCFCSPECATAYLMEENIDSSSKFERYHLINHIYTKIYDYNKNIKPAPNPYYMLEKYYGNLSIQEYRALLRNERLFLIVDKPLTRILPELHEDNDDFIINNKIIPSNTYQIKKKLQKKQTKTNILSERFGLSQQ